jgi:hypothetical protein
MTAGLPRIPRLPRAVQQFPLSSGYFPVDTGRLFRWHGSGTNMSPQARMAAGNAAIPEAGVGSSDSEAGVGPFVLNLTSSTTPMALAHPDSPELKRFSFFVSRRREDNRERFRLHMGYFPTLAEAEEWLNIIRDLYPGAWAGEAPGKKLRARAAAAELAKQLPPPPAAAAQSAAPAVVTATRPPMAPRPASMPATVTAQVSSYPSAMAGAPGTMAPATVAIEVPTLQAAPTLPQAPQAAVTGSAAPMLEAVAQATAALAAVAKMAQSSAGAFGAADQTVMAPNPFISAPVNKAISQPAFTPAPAAPVAAAQPPRAPARASAAPVSAPQPAAVAAAPVSVSAQPVAPRVPTQPAKPAAAAPAPKPSAQPPKQGGAAKGIKKNPGNALTDGSNVREVMASLDENTGETRQMQIPPGLRSSAPAAKPAASVTASASATAPGARPSGAAAGRAPTAPAQNAIPGTLPNLAQPGAQNVAKSARGPAVPAADKLRVAAPPSARAPAANAPVDPMSDTQVLRMLETRRGAEGEKGTDDANAGISLLKPDDTQTRRALKEAVIGNAPVSFAVQLQWSVQPVQLDKVPPLAIFSAYTLYTVEGSREGRKWYGLRLGFFSDAISAKQVAYYVRSEFASVAVVPVSPAEKSRASDEDTKAATGAFQRKRVEQKAEEFKLFEDDKSVVNEPPPKAVAAPKAPAAAVGKGVPARKNKPLGRVRAKEQRSPKTLEETLEILGASDLEIDNGRGELLNDTGVRHLRVEVQKNTPFGKLLDRISERVRKN